MRSTPSSRCRRARTSTAARGTARATRNGRPRVGGGPIWSAWIPAYAGMTQLLQRLHLPQVPRPVVVLPRHVGLHLGIVHEDDAPTGAREHGGLELHARVLLEVDRAADGALDVFRDHRGAVPPHEHRGMLAEAAREVLAEV